MVIKPKYRSNLFLKIYGEFNTDTLHPDWVWIQRERANAWDSAIEYAILNSQIQQPVLTHPVVPSGTHPQPQSKGD